MKQTFVLHDYENCLVNLANSVVKSFMPESEGRTLPGADKYLQKNYKNAI